MNNKHSSMTMAGKVYSSKYVPSVNACCYFTKEFKFRILIYYMLGKLVRQDAQFKLITIVFNINLLISLTIDRYAQYEQIVLYKLMKA